MPDIHCKGGRMDAAHKLITTNNVLKPTSGSDLRLPLGSTTLSCASRSAFSCFSFHRSLEHWANWRAAMGRPEMAECSAPLATLCSHPTHSGEICPGLDLRRRKWHVTVAVQERSGSQRHEPGHAPQTTGTHPNSQALRHRSPNAVMLAHEFQQEVQSTSFPPLPCLTARRTPVLRPSEDVLPPSLSHASLQEGPAVLRPSEHPVRGLGP